MGSKVWLAAATCVMLTLTACGGGGTQDAFAPSTVPQPVMTAAKPTGAGATVVHLYQALYRMAPSYALMTDYMAPATSDAPAFAKNLASAFSSTSHADLAKLVLSNLGVTATTVPAINGKGQSEYALLLDAVQQIFTAFPTMRGQVILNMTNLLEGLEADATYGAAAIAYNNQATVNYDYATNSVNTNTRVVALVDSGVASITGRVVDGYIQGAKVFWDCNSNHNLDDGEISTTTTSGGNYTIADKLSANCTLDAYVGWDAVDEDYPNQTVGIGYTMVAVPGKPELITPFTTLVAGQLKAGSGKTIAEIDRALASAMGTTGSTLGDYKRDGNVELGNNARFATKFLKQTVVSNDYAAQINQQATSFQNAASLPGNRATISAGLIPFVYEPNSVFNAMSPYLPKSNSSNIVIRTHRSNTQSDNDYLDEIAKTLSAQHAGSFGFINFDSIDSTVNKQWMFQILNRKIGQDDPSRSASIEAFRRGRTAALTKLSNELLKPIIDEGAVEGISFDPFFKDGPATFEYLLEVSSMMINIEVDLLSVASFGYGGKLVDLAKGTKKGKIIVQRLMDILGGMGTGVKVAKCGNDAAGFFLNDSKIGIDFANSCIFGLAVDLIADIKLVQKHKTISAAIKAGGAFSVFSGDYYSAANGGAARTREALRLALDLFDVLKEASAVVPDPATGVLMAKLDFARQVAGCILAAFDLADKAIEVNEKAYVDIVSAYDVETRKIFASYYSDFLSTYSNYFTIVDKTVNPYAVDLSYFRTKPNEMTVLLVGNNFPSVSLSATLGSSVCTEQSVGSAFQRQFSCIQNSSAVVQPFIALIDSTPIPGSQVNIVLQPGIATANISAPTTIDKIFFWIKDAYLTVKSVVWKIVDAANRLVAGDTLGGDPNYPYSYVISSRPIPVGQYTATAILKDAAGKELGTSSVQLSVVPTAIATITGAMDDFGQAHGPVTNGGSTDDTTPALNGTISAALAANDMQHVNVYDGANRFATVATVTGTNWTFAPTTPLTVGTHSFTAEVATFDGTPGTRSAPYVVNIAAVDPTSSPPVMSNIQPAIATIGVATTFTVTGLRLPLTAVMSIADGSCQTPTGASAAGFAVVCTPGGAVGSKIVTIKTDTPAHSGSVIDESRTVSVIAGPSTPTNFVVPATSYPGVAFTNPSAKVATCSITAAGSWTNGGGTLYKDANGYKGLACGTGCRAPTAPTHSLLMVRRSLGVDTSAVFIGSTNTVTLAGGETVYFSTNDGVQPYQGRLNAYFDNAGSMTVSIQCQ